MSLNFMIKMSRSMVSNALLMFSNTATVNYFLSMILGIESVV